MTQQVERVLQLIIRTSKWTLHTEETKFLEDIACRLQAEYLPPRLNRIAVEQEEISAFPLIYLQLKLGMIATAEKDDATVD